jgi:uncharacterized RDD family membrane protein YckC
MNTLPTVQQAKDFVPVGRWRRFANLAIDSFVCFLFLIFIVQILAGSGFSLERTPLARGLVLGSSGVLFWTYFFVCEALGGRTLGKFCTGTRAVGFEKKAGKSLSWKSAALRSLFRFLPLEPLSIFLSKNSTPWHDSLSKTSVIRA